MIQPSRPSTGSDDGSPSPAPVAINYPSTERSYPSLGDELTVNLSLPAAAETGTSSIP